MPRLGNVNEEPLMSTEQNPTFQALAEQFIDRYRADSRLTVESFAEEYPHARDIILDEFPALMLAEILKGTGSQVERTDRVPKEIGQYRMKSVIGRGGMGVVYAARHAGLEKDVAIKVLPLESGQSPAVLQRFHVEARASAAMDHPNIVPVYDHGIQGNLAYLVMRRIHGVSLERLVDNIAVSDASESNTAREHVPEGSEITLDWGFISEIGSQIASALQYAHEQGVIHRDIKPANIILDSAGKTWVTDFGLAKVLQSNLHLSMTGDVVGTLRYMAPEQLRGVSDARSDIFGLGLTLYELATGQDVWSSLSKNEILANRSSLELQDVRELNPAVPEPLAMIIMTACAHAPEDRYQTAEEVAHALNRFSHGDPVANRRRSRTRADGFSRRTAAGIAAVVGCVLALAVWSVNQIREPENPYQDRESALHILEDEQVRGRFVRELPALLGSIVNDPDREVRTVVADLAADAIVESVNDLNASDEHKQQLYDELSKLETPYVEGGIANTRFIAKVNEVASVLENSFDYFKLTRQAIAQSSLPKSQRDQGEILLALLKQQVAKRELDAVQIADLEAILGSVVIHRGGSDVVSDDELR